MTENVNKEELLQHVLLQQSLIELIDFRQYKKAELGMPL